VLHAAALSASFQVNQDIRVHIIRPLAIEQGSQSDEKEMHATSNTIHLHSIQERLEMSHIPPIRQKSFFRKETAPRQQDPTTTSQWSIQLASRRFSHSAQHNYHELDTPLAKYAK
jgi:hypothetical protein